MANYSPSPEPTRRERSLLPPALNFENVPLAFPTILEVLERRRATRAEDNPLPKRLYILEYASLPLPPDSRKELEQRYAERARRFRERVKQWPRDIKTHDYEELIRGRLLDFHNLLPDNTPLEAHQRLLREHANRLLNDQTTQQMVASVAKPPFTDRESWLANLMSRRLYDVDELVQEVIAMGAADGPRAAPLTKQRIPDASDSIGQPEDGATREGATESVASVQQCPRRAEWLYTRLAERGWTKHDLQRNNGPDHKTTQKILDGHSVQDGVLWKVILGLSAATTRRGRDLPTLELSDIPND